jgi:hypothetical protein
LLHDIAYPLGIFREDSSLRLLDLDRRRSWGCTFVNSNHEAQGNQGLPVIAFGDFAIVKELPRPIWMRNSSTVLDLAILSHSISPVREASGPLQLDEADHQIPR